MNIREIKKGKRIPCCSRHSEEATECVQCEVGDWTPNNDIVHGNEKPLHSYMEVIKLIISSAIQRPSLDTLDTLLSLMVKIVTLMP